MIETYKIKPIEAYVQTNEVWVVTDPKTKTSGTHKYLSEALKDFGMKIEDALPEEALIRGVEILCSCTLCNEDGRIPDEYGELTICEKCEGTNSAYFYPSELQKL